MNLEFTFSGLCHFVKVYQQEEEAEVLDRVMVLMVDASQWREMPGLPQPGFYSDDAVQNHYYGMDHYPYLEFPLSLVQPGAPAGLSGYWPLSGGTIKILDEQGTPLGGLVLNDEPLSGPVPCPGNEGSFQWLAEMDRVLNTPAGQHLEVDSSLIQDGTVAYPLISRVQISGGNLQTSSVVRDSDQNPIQWHFDPDLSGTLTQALADEVVLKFENAPNNIIIRKESEKGVIEDLHISSQTPVRLNFMNHDATSLLKKTTIMGSSRIDEFKWFYKLFEVEEDRMSIPVKEKTLSGNPYCPFSQSKFILPQVKTAQNGKVDG